MELKRSTKEPEEAGRKEADGAGSHTRQTSVMNLTESRPGHVTQHRLWFILGSSVRLPAHIQTLLSPPRHLPDPRSLTSMVLPASPALGQRGRHSVTATVPQLSLPNNNQQGPEAQFALGLTHKRRRCSLGLQDSPRAPARGPGSQGTEVCSGRYEGRSALGPGLGGSSLCVNRLALSPRTV